MRDEDEEDDEDNANKCLKVNGRVIRKSAVGDNVFLVLKSQQDAITKAAEREAVETFTKRATSSMAQIGKSDEIATLLRSVQKSAGNDIAEAVAKKFEQAQRGHQEGQALYRNWQRRRWRAVRQGVRRGQYAGAQDGRRSQSGGQEYRPL